jgi:putative hydrolase
MGDLAKKYKMLYDHHTHTVYSHGAGTIEDNVRAAHEKGLREIAITDHGPGNIAHGMGYVMLPKMRGEIEPLKEKYPDVNILLGVEANIQRKAPYMDVIDRSYSKFDIVLAGYHFAVLGAGSLANWNYMKKHSAEENPGTAAPKLLEKNTQMIINCLYYAENHLTHVHVLTHPGDKGPFDIDRIAYACARTKTLIEICGTHPFLTVEGIREAARHDVKFVIGSDAHRPEDVGMFEPQLERALEAGLDVRRIVNIGLK